MNFGPLVPQEIEATIEFLERNNIPFEIHFNKEEANKELEPSPGNNILYSELRTKAYLAQHFYVEVPEEFLANNPKVESQILRFITKDHFEDAERLEEESYVHPNEEKALGLKAARTKWIQKAISILFLALMLYGLLASIFDFTFRIK